MRFLFFLPAGLAAIALFAEAPATKEFTALQKKWWAFQPVAHPAPPVATAKWVKSPIDQFVYARMATKGVTPNEPADRLTLLRRASLVVTGLPPSPGEVQDFLSDNSPDAFEKVVARLLSSPRYGEHWARHWLDVARYADSDGFKADDTRFNIWRYRDYVIRSFNGDKPYSRFVQEQIAGDELFPGNADALIATGFNRHFPDEYNAANVLLRRQETLNDITDTVGSAFLGLTFGCARCHDHKFDPILHKDYYRLQSFFANVKIDDHAKVMPSAERSAWLARRAVWEQKSAGVRQQMEDLLAPARQKFYGERLSRFPEEVKEALTMPAEKRNPLQWQVYLTARTQVTFTDAEIAARLKGEDAKQYKALAERLERDFGAIKPADELVAQVMVDSDTPPPDTFVLKGGNYDAPAEKVAPGFLTLLAPGDAAITPIGQSSGRRAALARWLTEPSNPLTARVMVNRVWHYMFGKGIAGTPSDFGLMGERPADLPLLDYLTGEFTSHNWSIKNLQRSILLSSAWQQSSLYNEANAKIDPDNKLLWHYPRHRLEGESIRDSALQVAGKLNTEMYGPGVFPPMPAGVVTRGGWKKTESESEANRRSVYIFVRRNTRYPMLDAFDLPDSNLSCARRNATVNPSQSLELLNDGLMLQWSRDFADRVGNDRGVNLNAKIERAWKLAYARPPKPGEINGARDFLAGQEKASGSEANALADLCHMLLSSSEFLYIN